MDIGLSVQGRNALAVSRDIEAEMQNYAFPAEYHAEVLNNLSAQQEGQQRVLIACLIALVGIFLLLQASARSWRMALAILLMFPAALAGGILAAFLTGTTSTVASLLGLLTVLGIAVRHTLLTLTGYQRIETAEGKPFGPELVLLGSCERIAPTLMTVLTIAFVFLPFIFFGNIPGQEILHPMAIIVIGGLVTSTWLNLFALPSFYLRFGASREADLEFQQADLPVAAD